MYPALPIFHHLISSNKCWVKIIPFKFILYINGRGKMCPVIRMLMAYISFWRFFMDIFPNCSQFLQSMNLRHGWIHVLLISCYNYHLINVLRDSDMRLSLLSPLMVGTVWCLFQSYLIILSHVIFITILVHKCMLRINIHGKLNSAYHECTVVLCIRSAL